jgi:hypothetical protein
MSSARPSLVLTELQQLLSDPLAKQRLVTRSRENIRQFHTAGRVFDNFPSLLPTKEINNLVAEINTILPLPHPDNAIGLWLVKIAVIGCTEILDTDGHVLPAIASLLEWPADLSQTLVYSVMLAFMGQVTAQVLDALIKKFPAKIETPADEKAEAELKQFCLYVDSYKSKLLMGVLAAQKQVFDPAELEQLRGVPVTPALSEALTELLKDKRTQKALLLVAAGAMVGFAVHMLVSNFSKQAESKPVDESTSQVEKAAPKPAP